MSATREIALPRRWLELRGAAAALAFLTRVPVGRRLALDGEDVARAGLAFPLIGASLGAAMGGIAEGLATPLSPLLAAALAIAVGTLLSGALHLDALADTADAFGARSREHALEIMRDHAIGAYGAIALALDLLVKAAAIAALARDGHVLPFAIAAGALSRAVAVPLAAALPYARSGEGLARSLAATAWARAAGAAAIATLVAVLATGIDGLILAACTAILAFSLSVALARWLGGVTGDTLGAAVELTELAILVAGVALAGGR